MEDRDKREKEIRELFGGARRLDRTSAPDYRSMRASIRERARRSKKTPTLSFAVMTGTASVVVAAGVIWIAVKTPTALEPPSAVATVTEAAPQAATSLSDAHGTDLPVPRARYYQNVLTTAPGVPDSDSSGDATVHGSRDRDFTSMVGGVRNVDPLTGHFMSQVNPNSIEEVEVVTAGASAEFGRLSGGFARINMTGQSSASIPPPGNFEVTFELNTESYSPIEENGFRSVLDHLLAGGSTNGGQGIQLAYRIARENFVPGGINRVILATDGDFNVGITNQSELLNRIRRSANKGIFLTTLGFGEGNYQDDMLERLADEGNGNYAYIDSPREARKVLVEQIGGTLVTIAKDVKIQVEFNPGQIAGYRLIGYENRMLRKEDVNDDQKDAGEIGAGHTVTALYEIVPMGVEVPACSVDPLKYQRPAAPTAAAESEEIFTLKLRYKEPEADSSKLLSFPVVDDGFTLSSASPDFKFASAVAGFGMVLRKSRHAGIEMLEPIRTLALEGAGTDENRYRAEFRDLVEVAAPLLQRRVIE